MLREQTDTNLISSDDFMIQQDVSGCLEARIGEQGFSDTEYTAWIERAAKSAKALKGAYEDETLALLHIPEKKDDLEIAREQFFELINGAKTVVFLGTGGSSLGGQTIAQMGGWSIPGDQVKGEKKLPRTRIYDNLDPRSLKKGIGLLDLETTRFVIISKSGNTAETLLQTIVVLDAYRRAGLEDRIGSSILGLSEVRQSGLKNGLRDLLETEHGCPFLEHEKDIGGRFSCLTNVGLLLAIARGLDPFAIRAGASDVVTQLISGHCYDEFMPVVGAASCVGLYRDKNISNVVMMPYTNQLARFASWFVQLWAESLGKDGHGINPIAALGPVDQHSQLQLYMDGPIDKLITVVATASTGKGSHIPKDLAEKAGIDYMGDRHVGDLVSAQARATIDALQQARRPTRYIRIPEINEHVLGQLLMSFMVETIIAADLLGVNAFDQPAVEIGKAIARDHLRSL